MPAQTRWTATECLACALMIGEEADDENYRFPAALRSIAAGGPRDSDEETLGAAGSLLFGFGAQCESGLHLAATCNCVQGLRALCEIGSMQGNGLLSKGP